ncbi:MAG: hypothetical protein IMF11_08965 [Proteobacteria bacterium]|nr:hypothetical protein [Pseudomonadota bacterium]
MEGFRVRCRTCGQVMYETTDRYTCHKPLTGDMLKLLPLYKDWPCYDGSLAVSSTSHLLMFCTMCAGYITHIDRLQFADFHDEKVHTISNERSEMPWWDSPVEAVRGELVDNLIIPDVEDSMLTDESKAKEEAITPKEMMKKLEKRAKTSRKKRRK